MLIFVVMYFSLSAVIARQYVQEHYHQCLRRKVYFAVTSNFLLTTIDRLDYSIQMGCRCIER